MSGVARETVALGRASSGQIDPRRAATSSWDNDSLLAGMVVSACGGDEHAFEELVVTIGPPVYRYLVLRLGNDADARDALQETLLAAWLSLQNLRRPESFRSWILTIATRKAAGVARRKEPVVPTETDQVVVSSGSDSSIQVRLALNSLPQPWRDVLVIRYVAGLSEAETARALRVRIGTVKSRAARARHRLATLLTENKSD